MKKIQPDRRRFNLQEQGDLENPLAKTLATPSNNPLIPDGLIMLNPSQFPEKLDGSNYLVWRDQVLDLLFESDLSQYIEEETTLPPESDATGRLRWNRQDRLLRHTLVSSLSSACKPLIGSARTYADVWKTLERLYGTRSPSAIRNLKDQFRHMRRGDQPVGEYLHKLRTLADELTLTG
ncbi:unnamed protein product [Cuscuta europaea]|uniref:Retrotransposon Copia-like N-terminal domain-containing protein n=1 Tax=Cuscuta europaea TaxID=41803 RepID=A0A9P1ELT3_CUSEU|nr:unnamed protein product [Cuscuta europaea]